MKTTLYTIESEEMVDQIGLPVSNAKSGSGSGSGSGPDEGSGSGSGSGDPVEIQKFVKEEGSIIALPYGYNKITFECLLTATAEFSVKFGPKIKNAVLKFLVSSSYNKEVNNYTDPPTTTEYFAYPTKEGHHSFPLGNYSETSYRDKNFEYTLKKVVKKGGDEETEESTHNVSIRCDYSMELQEKDLIVKITSASGSFS